MEQEPKLVLPDKLDQAQRVERIFLWLSLALIPIWFLSPLLNIARGVSGGRSQIDPAVAAVFAFALLAGLITLAVLYFVRNHYRHLVKSPEQQERVRRWIQDRYGLELASEQLAKLSSTSLAKKGFYASEEVLLLRQSSFGRQESYPVVIVRYPGQEPLLITTDQKELETVRERDFRTFIRGFWDQMEANGDMAYRFVNPVKGEAYATQRAGFAVPLFWSDPTLAELSLPGANWQIQELPLPQFAALLDDIAEASGDIGLDFGEKQRVYEAKFIRSLIQNV